MQKSKFLTLFRALSPKEVVDFKNYLKRVRGGDGVALSIFDYAKKFHPTFQDEGKLDPAIAYQKIFREPLGANKSNRFKLLNALSDLHLWLKDFLILEKLKADSFESRSFWMSILKERGLMAEFSRKASLLQQEVEKMPMYSIPDYMKGMVSNYFFYYHLTSDKLRQDITALKDCGNELDLFYAVCRLKIACEVANRKHLMSQEPDLEVLPAIIELSKNIRLSDHPLLALYFKVYELISKQQDFHYPSLESMLRDNVKKIAPEEMHTILSYLHNHLALRIRHGDEGYVALTHQLNRFADEYKVLATSGEISSSQFTNIVNVACSSNDLDWASSFIKNYQQLLPKNVRLDSVCLSEAILLYEIKDYEGVLVKLREVSYPDLFYAIRAKSLILRSQYELNSKAWGVIDFCLSFESYLKRHRKPKREAVEATLTFIGIVKKLARGNVAREALINDIQNINPVYFKGWLLEKAALYGK